MNQIVARPPKYPFVMRHPGYRKATVTGDKLNQYTLNKDGSAAADPSGITGQFGARWAHDLNQEQYYAAMGYAPEGVADVEAYRRELCGLNQDPNYPRALYRLKPDGEMDSAVAENAAKHQALEKEGWRVTQSEARALNAKKVPATSS